MLREVYNRKLDEAIDRAVANNPRIKFIKAMQMHMLRRSPAMDRRRAWAAAVAALRNFLEDERCEFGDQRFDWTRSGAATLIEEYEMSHWEAADAS